MERHGLARTMQHELIADLERRQPPYLVAVWVSFSWLMTPTSERAIFAWLEEARRTRYERVGLAEIVSHDRTDYRWGADAASYVPQSRFWVEILRRRAEDVSAAHPY